MNESSLSGAVDVGSHLANSRAVSMATVTCVFTGFKEGLMTRVCDSTVPGQCFPRPRLHCSHLALGSPGKTGPDHVTKTMK